MNYQLLPHQGSLINSIHKYPDVKFFFSICGFGTGKSYADVMLLLSIVSWYQGQDASFGIGGARIKHLRATVVKDFLQCLDRNKVSYKHNSQSSLIQVGTLIFVYFSLEDTDSIFGYNFSGTILDEVDELSVADKVRESILAVSERTRVRLPRSNKGNAPRSPFITVTSTAQGMRGLYLFVQYLNKIKFPYVLIKGRTKDNIHLDPSYIKTLYALYTPDEAKAYLDAEFVNLTTGRVYWAYDPAKHIHMSFGTTQDDTIYVGQDFNPGYNAAVAMIVRAGVIYVIGDYKWLDMRDGIKKMRDIWPLNNIVLCPDVSGKEIMVAIREELSLHQIECVWGRINPSINDRIVAINKLFQDNKLYILQGCGENINTCWQMRDYDDSGNPRKERGPKSLDHHGDASEYAVWTIIHRITAFDDLVKTISMRSSHAREMIDNETI